MNYFRAIVARTTFPGNCGLRIAPNRSGALLFCPLCQPRPGHAFAQAALFDKRLLQFADELVEQVVSLVNEANQDI
jgi:hypothetical protein